MADPSSNGNQGNTDRISDDYFLERVQEDTPLTPPQHKFYFSLPDFHRELIELTVLTDPDRDTDIFTYNLIVTALDDLFGERIDEGLFFERHRSLALDLWATYQERLSTIANIMPLSAIADILYPLDGFHYFQDDFIQVIAKAVEEEKINNYGGEGEHTKVRLIELEVNLYDELEPLERCCVRVWRQYLDTSRQRYLDPFISPSESPASDIPNPNYFIDQNGKYSELLKDAYYAFWARFGKQPTRHTLWANLPSLCPEYQVSVLVGADEKTALNLVGMGLFSFESYRRHFKAHFPELT